MPLNVSRALHEGLRWTVSRRGIPLIVAFAIIALVGNVGFDSATVALYDLATTMEPGAVEPLPEGATPLALPIPGSMILFVLLAWLLAWTAASVTTVRVMATDPTEPVTADRLSERLTVATVNELIARILIAIAISVGLVLFIIPGVFLAINLYFVRPLIAVEDRNFADALVESWNRSKGRRFDVFVLLIGGSVLYVIILLPGLLGSVIAGSIPILASVVYMAVSAIATVFWLSVVARAYVQILDDGGIDDVDDEGIDDGEEAARRAEADRWDDPPGVEW